MLALYSIGYMMQSTLNSAEAGMVYNSLINPQRRPNAMEQ